MSLSQRRLFAILATVGLVAAACARGDAEPDCQRDRAVRRTRVRPGAEAAASASAAAGDVIKATPGESVNMFLLPKFTGVAVSTRPTKAPRKRTRSSATRPTYEYNGPDQASSAAGGQLEYVTNAPTQGFNAMMISNNSGDQIEPAAVAAAKEAGMKVVTWDSPIPSGEGEDLFVAQVDFDETGVVMADMALEILGAEGGEFAILSATADAANQNAWIASLEETLADPEVREPRVGRHGLRRRRLRDELRRGARTGRRPSGPQADHGPDDGRHRLRRQGHDRRGPLRDGQGLRPGPSGRDVGVRPSGCSPQFALWSFVDLGYATYQATYQIATGALTAEEGATFTAGRMGDYTIEKDPTRDNGLRIVMGPFTVYDETNVDQ